MLNGEFFFYVVNSMILLSKLNYGRDKFLLYFLSKDQLIVIFNQTIDYLYWYDILSYWKLNKQLKSLSMKFHDIKKYCVCVYIWDLSMGNSFLEKTWCLYARLQTVDTMSV